MTRTVRRTVMTRVPTFARTLRRTVTGRPAARARRAGVGSVTVTFTRLPFFRVRLTLVPFWRAGAMMVARDLTVAPAVVAFVGAWAVVARAGGVPVAGVVDDGGAAVGSGAVADHRNVTALDAPC